MSVIFSIAGKTINVEAIPRRCNPPPNLPENFGKVTDKIFRGAWPTPENLGKLKEYGVETVATLFCSTEEELEKASHLAGELGQYEMRHLLLEISGRDSFIKAARQISQTSGTYVHCLAGANRTGIVVVLVQIFHTPGETGKAELTEMLKQALQHGFDYDKPYKAVLETILTNLYRQGLVKL